MKLRLLKQSLLIIAALFVTVCFYTACTKPNTAITNTNYNPNSGTSTTGTGTSNADTVASFNFPTGIAVDATGNVYVADYGNNIIRKITTAGVVSTVAGNGNIGVINGPDSLASFNGPTSLALDVTGNVYVADDNNNRIRKISGGMVSTFAGSDSTGLVNGPGTSAAFFGPEGICIDRSGNLYVADAGNSLVRMITPTGVVGTLAGSGNPGLANGALLTAQFDNPTGIAIDGSGNLYVADFLNNMIREINITADTVSILAGSGNAGATNGIGRAASFNFPNSVAVDAAGNVYAAETYNNLIRKITPGGAVSTFAGSGAQGMADGMGIAASFSGPSGVAVDAAGNVYVADTYNNLIRKITPAGVVSTIAGSGNAGASNGKALAYHRPVNLAHVSKHTTKTLFNIFVKKRTRQ